MKFNENVQKKLPLRKLSHSSKSERLFSHRQFVNKDKANITIWIAKVPNFLLTIILLSFNNDFYRKEKCQAEKMNYVACPLHSQALHVTIQEFILAQLTTDLDGQLTPPSFSMSNVSAENKLLIGKFERFGPKYDQIWQKRVQKYKSGVILLSAVCIQNILV